MVWVEFGSYMEYDSMIWSSRCYQNKAGIEACTATRARVVSPENDVWMGFFNNISENSSNSSAQFLWTNVYFISTSLKKEGWMKAQSA